LPIRRKDALSLFPEKRDIKGKRRNKKMKVFQKLLFTLIAIAGLSVAASAQKQDNPKKPPPKENPPVVTPNVKPPKNDDRPKKPRSELIPFYEPPLSRLV
jgi:hypothetical protein